jgi:hypothetical protein
MPKTEFRKFNSTFISKRLSFYVFAICIRQGFHSQTAAVGTVFDFHLWDIPDASGTSTCKKVKNPATFYDNLIITPFLCIVKAGMHCNLHKKEASDLESM